MIAITNGTVVLPDRTLPNTNVIIDGGRIATIGGPVPAGADLIPATDLFILPGLIDVHTHGRLIFSDAARSDEYVAKDCADLPATGVTRFLPTLASAPLTDWFTTLAQLAPVIGRAGKGAVPIGIHLEGNFLNPAAAGAHPPTWLFPFNPDEPEHALIFETYGEIIKLVTLAPEVAGNERLLPVLSSRGIAASLGHSNASPEFIGPLVDRGLCHMTHLFNGMKGLYHRDPGPALAGLLDDRISVDIICDGFHVHPQMIRLVHRLKQPKRRILITDCCVLNVPGITAGGDDEPNVLQNGAYAGSRLRLCSAIRNYMRFTGCALPEAVAMASLYPAALIGMEKEFGSIEEGKVADLWLAGPDLKPTAVMVAGERVL